MTAETVFPQDLVRRAVIEIARLPENDLLLVIEFVADLKQMRAAAPAKVAAAQIRAEAQRRAAQLGNLSREELVARFNAVTERIRAQAIANGTAIEGDWEGD
jgi:hypothetical protein